MADESHNDMRNDFASPNMTYSQDQAMGTGPVPPSDATAQPVQNSGATSFMLFWLGLSCVGTVGFGVYGFYQTQKEIAESADALATFEQYGMDYIGGLHKMLIVSAVDGVAYIAAAISAIVAFKKRWPSAVSLAAAAFLFLIISNGQGLYDVFTSGEILKNLSVEIKALARSFICSIAWLIYLFASQNVKDVIPTRKISPLAFVFVGIAIVDVIVSIVIDHDLAKMVEKLTRLMLAGNPNM